MGTRVMICPTYISVVLLGWKTNRFGQNEHANALDVNAPR